MGRTKQDDYGEYSFQPKISSASKRLAARRLESLDYGGLPHFMRDIKCRSRDPLAPIPPNPNKSKQTADTSTESRTDSRDSKNTKEEPLFEKTVLAQNTIKFKYDRPGYSLPLRTGMMGSKSEVLLDDNIFTFRPKVSTTSVKIVESLGTDFMSRQQMHLEKQKRHAYSSVTETFTSGMGIQINIEQAPIHFSSQTGRLSPVFNKNRKTTKKSNNENEDNSIDNSNITSDQQAADSETEKSQLTAEELEEEADGMPASLSLSRNKTSISPNLQRLLDGPYSNGNPDMVLKRQRSKLINHQLKGRVGDSSDLDTDGDITGTLSRSKTMPSLGRPKMTRKITNLVNSDRLKIAKETAEKAIKQRKIFTIQGGYSAVRHSLRKRGWVEKFYKMAAPPKKTKRKRRKTNDDDDDDNDNDDDDDDDDDDTDTDSDNDQPKIPPWEEEDGVYGIMSRIVRNINPTFIWVLKRDVIDYRFLAKEQIINHYCKAGSFTTKVGMCVNMRNVPWFHNSDPELFFPRCFRLSHEEEKAAFIDDFRLTACMGVLKMVTNQYTEHGLSDSLDGEEKKDIGTEKDDPSKPAGNFICTNLECTRSRPGNSEGNICVHAQEKLKQEEKEKRITDLPQNSSRSTGSRKPVLAKKKKRVHVPYACLQRAMQQCERFLSEKDHDDIDQQTDIYEMQQQQWDETLHWYYQMVHEGGMISSIPENILTEVEHLTNRLKAKHSQYDLDGYRNVWIVKPGAKSRGRGIVCYDRLDDMLKLVSSQVVRKDNKYVVQKYMERPLLIYNTKFDIRQWFLVTDWNPLTLWFYQDSYLRFCSQQYTLDDFDESIHLSNNAIQKNYKNGPRSSNLPNDNMWSHEEFKDYIRNKKLGNLWDEVIYPGMKKAIICALLCTQDLIEYRKSSFELYGADFMLTEDYKPWLIEINSSPSMESSTSVTSHLCASVLEDTIKVVVDRKYDKNCDIGRFELAYKQPVVTVPPYIGISLAAEGTAIRRPGGFVRRNNNSDNNNDSYFSPRKQVIFHDSKDSSKPSFANTGVTKRPNSENLDMSSHKASSVSSAPAKSSKSNQESSTLYSSRYQRRVAKNSPPTQTRKSPSSGNQIVASSSTSSNHSDSSGGDGGGGGVLGGYGAAGLGSGYNNKENFTMQASLFPKPDKSTSLPVSSYITVPGKRMVSRSSVSSNYTIPSGIDKQDRPTLAVNNVESTDLKTIKPSPSNSSTSKGKRRRKKRHGHHYNIQRSSIKYSLTKGSPYTSSHKLPEIKVHIVKQHHHSSLSPLIDGAWGRTCAECGSGNNLHLDLNNPNCKCRQDSVYFPSSERARSAKGFFPRPRSSYGSPRPPSACSNKSSGSQGSCTNLAIIATSKTDSKVLLKYTDGGIQQPVTTVNMGVNPLPKIVRRYIGRRSAASHDILSGMQSSTVFLDTTQLHNPLSIISHSVYNR